MTTVMKMKDFRVVIRNNREKKGWSQYRLAKETGVAQSFINEIEGGKKSPSIEVFFRICEALEIKVFPDEEEML